jgi:phosphoribosylformylglycinamidine synthase
MKTRVYVTLKNGVLSGVRDVRAGKLIELDLADDVGDEAVEAMCRRLLANTVIENFRIEREGAA